MTTQERGELAQLKIEQRALEKGYSVSKPTMHDSRYDCVIDDGSKLWRVQVKYANGTEKERDGTIRVYLKMRHKNSTLKYTVDEIDMCLFYIPVIDKTLAFSSEIIHNRSSINVRIKPLKNGRKPYFWYEDYIW